MPASMFALLAAAGSAAALLPPPPAPSAQADIVVTAREHDRVRHLVAALTWTLPDRQIARWDRAICPRVSGLVPPYARFVEERILDAARLAGLRRDRPCGSDISVVFTPDADRIAADVVRDHPDFYRQQRDGRPPRAERDRFLQPGRPVRWILANRLHAEDQFYASRIRQQTWQEAAFALVIVDTRRLREVSWQQLADYFAMVALAQPDPTAVFPAGTVLATFQPDGAPAPAGLTRTDRAFLQALYASEPKLLPHLQRAQIAGEVERRLADAGP